MALANDEGHLSKDKPFILKVCSHKHTGWVPMYWVRFRVESKVQEKRFLFWSDGYKKVYRWVEEISDVDPEGPDMKTSKWRDRRYSPWQSSLNTVEHNAAHMLQMMKENQDAAYRPSLVGYVTG